MTERACENCGASLADQRSDAKFCGATCRSLYWKTAHASDAAKLVRKAVRNVYSDASNGNRRPSRNGLGTKLYVTPSELREVADRFTAEPGSTALHRKIAAAMERVR